MAAATLTLTPSAETVCHCKSVPRRTVPLAALCWYYSLAARSSRFQTPNLSGQSMQRPAMLSEVLTGINSSTVEFCMWLDAKSLACKVNGLSGTMSGRCWIASVSKRVVSGLAAVA